jgi:hypothetical protein
LLDATGTEVANACTQIGPYRSLWIHLDDPSDPRAAAAIQHHSAFFATGALYVVFDEWSSHLVLQTTLRSCGFKFYAHKEATNELVYYKWCRGGVDKVPKTATSIEGAAVRHARAFQREDLTLRVCRGNGACFVA